MIAVWNNVGIYSGSAQVKVTKESLESSIDGTSNALIIPLKVKKK